MSDAFGRVADYYDGLVDRYGHHFRACDYGRAESQRAKFRVMSEVCPLEGKRILDVGCGFADFAGHLAESGLNVRYVGVDLSARMVAEARRLHPAADIRHGNLLDMDFEESFDVVMANGIFYLLGADAEGLMHRLIRRMFDLAREAVAFNALSTWAKDQEAGEFYADPLETAAFCRRLSERMTLRHDYHGRDFTLYLYKPLGP